MTLELGERRVEELVADANVLLSAVCGHAALKVFTEYSIAVNVTRKTLDEVREYIPFMAEKYGTSAELLELQLRLLAPRAISSKDYEDKIKEARTLIEKRDPDDVEVLALALKLSLPVRSNDRDFDNTGIRVYSTARLLKILAEQKTRSS